MISPTVDCPACGTVLSEQSRVEGVCPACRTAVSGGESRREASHVEGDGTQLTVQGATGFLAPGQTLGNRYRIRSQLGRGGMGEVWRAFDLKLRVDLAVKALRTQLLTDERALETLRQEVRSAREVVSPNVCRVFDLEELDGRELVSMEYIDGTTLAEILSARSPLELGETREIALQFLAGLEAIHEAGLVHRDIKTENVMITRSGRVVVMDFGITKSLAAAGTGTVAGTPAYMAPEQQRGDEVDARADVFAAGVVLAEMTSPEGVREPEARRALLGGVRENPPRLPESPWQGVLERAVAVAPEARFATASGLSRALEEMAVRVEGAEDLKPYPGLAAFGEEDAEYFFGRELEVEEMWKKLRRPHLLAVVGQSGAGKSSFLRAGLLASRPEGWGHVICTPKNAPFASLRESLVTEVSGDAEAMRELVRGEDLDALVSAASRWRQRHKQALVILDQFEELFTLNPVEEQSRFSELLGRLTLDADVHVLLSMRDDFLFHCSDQPALKPIFSELTLLRSPTGSSLRRALVQPALNCGYRFEDEGLVDEMVEEIREERGALPLVAFTAAALWERRDRESGLLTREAYEEIGGVAGALAQHAEATLERIGSERVPLVRELFRNLVTARGTRAACDREELLSVFEEREREAAAGILASLVDARLLTSYEQPAGEGEGEQSRHRIEIIHESLLSAWPRLVRWQTQDADSVQLRDQLRQAARTWEERERSDDLLWTGTAFREFELWRERYPGGLTETEESFEKAMTSLATRRKRLKRIALATASVVILAVLAVVTGLWRQSVLQTRRAEEETRRAEAQKLLALGQIRFETHHSEALAWARASLEAMDTPDGRDFALRALSRGPVARWLTPRKEAGPDAGVVHAVSFSPDGAWAALTAYTKVKVLPRSGQPLRVIDTFPAEQFRSVTPFFDSSGSQLGAWKEYSKTQELRAYSVPDLREVYRSEADLGEHLGHSFTQRGVYLYLADSGGVELQHWPVGEEPRIVGRIVADNCADPVGQWLVCWQDRQISLYDLDRLGSPPRRLRTHEQAIRRVLVDPGLEWIAVQDKETDLVTGWPLDEPGGPLWSFQSKGLRHLVVDPTGRRIAEGVALDGTAKAYVWDLASPGAEPLEFGLPDQKYLNNLSFDPSGRWLVVSMVGSAAFWPLPDNPVTVYSFRAPPESQIESGAFRVPGFTQDGKSLITLDGWWRDQRVLRVRPLVEGAEELELTTQFNGLARIRLDAERRLVVGASSGGRDPMVDGQVLVLPLDGSEPTRLRGFEGEGAWAVAYDAEQQLVAAAGGRDEIVIRVWSLRDGSVQVLAGEDFGDGEAGSYSALAFLPDGILLSCGALGVRSWVIAEGSGETLVGDRCRDVVVAATGRVAAAALVAKPPILIDLDSGEVRPLEGFRESRRFELAPDGDVVAAANSDGGIQVGRLSGGEPHLLYGYESPVWTLAFSPDGERLVSAHEGATTRIWRVPDLSEAPFHTLPYDELMSRLASVTNLRIVPDEEASTGYSLEVGPFSGWETVPTW